MKNAYIKLHEERDCAQMCESLIASSSVSRLSNNVFCVPWCALTLLDDCKIAYSFASEDDLANARPIWNFSPAPAR